MAAPRPTIAAMNFASTTVAPSPTTTVLTVSQLNRNVRHLLETQLPALWLEGEVSNFARPGSGHWYLTLKDSQAQVRCAMFRGANQRVGFTPSNGQQVLVRCRAGLYEPRGEYQLVIEQMQEAGHGALQRQFEQLKQRLADEGLFASEHKRDMPEPIRRVGVITSPSGAAIHDILSVLGRRDPRIEVLIYPTAVQGESAPAAIIQAIETANWHGAADVLIVGRGGGSLEDLWAFNSEPLARALYASAIPTISAVGHESDFTIADFVADLRAPTPSAAAELVSQDSAELVSYIAALQRTLSSAMRRQLTTATTAVSYLRQRLRHPAQRLQQQAQRLDQLEQQLQRSQHRALQQRQQQLLQLYKRLHRVDPALRLQSLQSRLAQQQQRLNRAIAQQLKQQRNSLQRQLQLLDAVSPLKVLERGYAVVLANGAAVVDSGDVGAGDKLTIKLHRGQIAATVTDNS